MAPFPEAFYKNLLMLIPPVLLRSISIDQYLFKESRVEQKYRQGRSLIDSLKKVYLAVGYEDVESISAETSNE
jgi:hypothetical protein